MSALDKIQQCACCGGRAFSMTSVLWPTLIDEWQLSNEEVQYVDRQQGLRCERCNSSLRTMALALAICRCYAYNGTLMEFVGKRSARRLRVLEINEAGNLTQFLSKLPCHTLAQYPQIDMMRLPYSAGSFDLVVHSDTLEHVSEPVAALAECYRILSPGGYCAFTVPVIVGRMTRSRSGLTPSFHGSPDERGSDLRVRTEYGCDAWAQVMCAGFVECRLVVAEFPSALGIVGVRSV